MKKGALYIGVDVGGTHMAAGLVDGEGTLSARAETPTLPGRPYEDIVRDMAACVMEALMRGACRVSDIVSIGVGIPGVAENVNGRVYFCPNLSWTDVPLRNELQKHIPLPVFIDNDATLAGYAESVVGISRHATSSVFLTLGTGVGASIIMGGKPWTGAHGVASEIGHLTLEIDGVPCTCGKDGCMERYCSATAIVRMARELLKEHPGWELSLHASEDAQNITAKMVFDLAREGDELSLRVFRRYVKYLSLAINSIISFIDPEMVVLGGGVSNAGAFLLDAVRAELPRYLMFKALPYARIELATLGNEAGIIGAALFGKTFIEGEQTS